MKSPETPIEVLLDPQLMVESPHFPRCFDMRRQLLQQLHGLQNLSRQHPFWRLDEELVVDPRDLMGMNSKRPL